MPVIARLALLFVVLFAGPVCAELAATPPEAGASIGEPSAQGRAVSGPESGTMPGDAGAVEEEPVRAREAAAGEEATSEAPAGEETIFDVSAGDPASPEKPAGSEAAPEAPAASESAPEAPTADEAGAAVGPGRYPAGPTPPPEPGSGADTETLLEELEAEITPSEIRLHLPSDASFGVNQHTLRPEAGEFLGKAARVIRAWPGRTVRVDGFTDFTGSQDYNRELSVKRAESVRRWLVEREGLTDTPFEVKGWGKSRPRATNRTEEGKSLNRRVEITIRTEP